MPNKSASKQSDDGIYSAFFYGTLMVPQVFSSVVYNTPSLPLSTLHTFIPALLHGYSRRRVRNADYPGILPTPTSSVFGTLVTGLTRANMAKLDYFEGDQYERRKVKVKVLDQVGDVKGEGNVEGEEVEAEVYVFLEVGELEEGEWDLEEFRREKLGKWTRAGFVFEDCDPARPATVAVD